MGHAKRVWYLSPMRAAKVQASLRICAVSPEPPLLAHTSNESRGTFRQKARFLAALNGWACRVKICKDGMLEDTNSLDAAHMIPILCYCIITFCNNLMFILDNLHVAVHHIFKFCVTVSFLTTFYVCCENIDVKQI